MKSLLISILIIYAFALVNAHTYESLGIDAIKKQEFENSIAKEYQFPIINISTRNNNELILSNKNYTDCVVDIFNVEDDKALRERSAGVKVRGNSSSYYKDVEKIKVNTVPYRIKFDKKVNLLGLHNGEKFKDWVLIKTGSKFIRNDIAYKFGKVIMEDKYFVTDSTHVNLYVNDVFQGIYVLCEQYKVNEKKVNITVPEKNYNGTDIGYYFEIDNFATYYDDEVEPYFTMDYENATVKDVLGEERQFVSSEYTLKSDFYCQEQLDFIGNYTKNVFKIIYLAAEKNDFKTFDENYHLVNATFTSAEETITNVMDIESVVDMYLLYEIVHDYDVGEKQ